jgi:hypothetical protein
MNDTIRAQSEVTLESRKYILSGFGELKCYLYVNVRCPRYGDGGDIANA